MIPLLYQMHLWDLMLGGMISGLLLWPSCHGALLHGWLRHLLVLATLAAIGAAPEVHGTTACAWVHQDVWPTAIG